MRWAFEGAFHVSFSQIFTCTYLRGREGVFRADVEAATGRTAHLAFSSGSLLRFLNYILHAFIANLRIKSIFLRERR